MRLIISAIALSFCLTLSAQEGKNFSMWFLNNLQHNPAAVGASDFDMKAFVNFRYQYFTVSKKPFQTLSASFEAKLLRSKTKKNHLGIGLSVINDMSGDGRYMVNDIMVPIAYHIYFNDNNSLSLGVSPGIYQRSVQPGNLTWESQWNGYEFNPGITAEPIARRSGISFDLGAGLFYKNQKSLTNKFYFGISARHILMPDIGFNIGDNLFRRYYFQFGLSHRFKRTNFGISPQLLAMMQGPNMNIVAGTNFDFYLRDASQRTIFVSQKKFTVGVYYRYMDAIIVNFGFYINGLTIAASYDANINTMLPSSKSVGAFEVSVAYDIMLNKRQKFLY